MRFMLHDEYIRHPDLNEPGAALRDLHRPVLAADVEITGSPTLLLELATTASDGAIHATLEQVMPNGQCRIRH